MPETYLVTGSTGNIGRSVVSTLLSLGHKVHAYTRNTSSKSAQELASTGATLFQGDFSTPSALSSAAQGCSGIFLLTIPGPDAPNFASTALEAFKSSALPDPVVVLITSIFNDEKTSKLVNSPNSGLPNKPPHPFVTGYWGMNDAVETVVKESGFPHWTILRPAYFMSNYKDFNIRYIHWPALSTEKKLVAGVTPETKFEMNDPHDIGVFAAHALVGKGQERWEHKGISLASELLTLEEQAAVISRVSGIEVTAEYMDEAEAAKLAEEEFTGYMWFWQKTLGAKVDMEDMRSYGLSVSSFEAYLTKHRDEMIRALHDTKEGKGGLSTDDLLAAAGQHGK
ncbi:hypothetical protein M409DRAFT_57875 [Zasmidium cellare ATCC 36951]|uniref:NAD(P)-binding domain-containing protein n=1 Tax=Zasmidium cellare ATCC 36951 TaxID=1080233 RepID=A0A6A6CA90_ZASCE|nr:uncharacterized protein M409DRAFT_57875 [Zasmidium cellare ATCC 36951]KAF2162812.1 hypothetical protein M409DRAFT_57875 [Zasmidium cellare ATCC 36951]